MSEKLKTFNVSLKTISPLHIGAGEQAVLSPYSDYVYVREDSSLLYIDGQKLQQLLAAKPELIDEYVAGIRDGYDNNRSNFSLDYFIRKRLKVDISEITRCRIPVGGEIQKNEVRCLIASSGRQFVPGSTIKGAIRTAVLLDWMTKTSKGKEYLNEIKNYVENEDWLPLKKSNPEKLCFGNISHDPFRHLRIGDSGFFISNTLSVRNIQRVSITQQEYSGINDNDIPLWLEVLMPGALSSFSISMQLPMKPTGFSFIDNQSIADLFKKINKQSLDSCSHEMKKLENSSRRFEPLKKFYEKLYLQIQRARPEVAVIRLGNGKTWYDNSIGLAVDNDNAGEQFPFEGYLRLLKLGELPFPSTRTLLVHNGSPSTPLGWVKLEVAETR
ncbi:MAG: type III-A CRISPR-associated RAMP protein Csm5 [Bacteroidales bacterium]|nr:type III-A CRISPR-associated RAMP protein Csm5 [Bacteroidales bacterium]